MCAHTTLLATVYLLSVVDGIICEHLPIIPADFIWILYFDDTSRRIHFDHLLVFGSGLFLFA